MPADAAMPVDGPFAALHRLVRRPLLAVAAFSLAMNLLLLTPAVFMLQVFDRVLASGSRETLAVLLIGAAVALALSFALDHVRSRLQGVVGHLVGQGLLPMVARRVLADRARATAAASGDALRDVATLRSLFSTQALPAIFDAPWAFVYIAIIWMAHPALGVTAALAAFTMLGLALLNDWLTRHDIETLQRSASRSQRYLESSIANAEVAEAMGMSDDLLGRWQKMNHDLRSVQAPLSRRSAALMAATRTVRQMVQIIMLAVGAYLVITQSATAGIMVATTILVGRALAPVEQIVGHWKLLVEGAASWRRLRELLGTADVGSARRMALPAPRGVLSAEGISLRAPQGGRPILAGVSLTLDAGESLAIVGPSGAGKSSLLRVLVGLLPPATGSVRLDGADLATWPRRELGPHIGYLPQDVELFAGTVAENIARLGEVDSSKVIEAARRANVHEMILALPDGYETLVDPQGKLISPGQRQRIALARALYGAPALLLLDEPNANLDGAGEEALTTGLRALAGSVTVVLVTHSARLVQHAHKTLALAQGQVVHYGATTEVLAALMNARSGAQVVAMPRSAAR